MRKWIPVSAAFAGMLSLWAAFENSSLLCVKKERVPFHHFPRTVHLSDLHRRKFGKENAALLRVIAMQQPELIVITGDLVSRSVTDFSEAERFLCRLREMAPVFAILGNHELDLPRPDLFRAMLCRAGVTLLDNEFREFHGIPFAGITLTRAHYRGGGLLGLRGTRACTVEEMRQSLGECPRGTVLLAHNPIFFPAYAEWGASLVLSGHIHGGAVRLPVIGGLLSPERRFFPKFDKGEFQIGESHLYVSGGLGKLRLFNPPEITVLSAAPECRGAE